MAIVIGKHILTGRPVEMIRQPDGKLHFRAVVPGVLDGIIFEIEPTKLRSALGPSDDEYLPPYGADDTKASFDMMQRKPVQIRQSCGCALGNRCRCTEETP